MKFFLRTIIVVSLLVGGSFVFKYWALKEFDKTFALIDTSLQANIISAVPKEILKTDLQNEDVFASSTKSIDTNISYLFPKKGNTLYMGCTYTIKLETAQSITSLKSELIDAGTRKPLGPITSGIPKEIKENATAFSWKIGTFWPGEYLIEVLEINEKIVELRSPRFLVEKMDSNLTPEDKERLCQKSGGV